MNTKLLDELIAADAQGERAIYTLWPGDQFAYKGEYRTIAAMQIVPPHSVSIKTECGKHYLFYGYLLFPAMLSDKHAEAERAEHEVW